MNIIKPLDISLLFKVFEWNFEQQFVATAMLGFSLEDGESMLESDLWKFISDELGKDAALDFCMPKTKSEALVFGSYFSPGGREVTSDRVGFSLGSISKELLVVGDRHWRPVIGPTPPEPFTTMPVDYAHAFGGAGFDRNPDGKGAAEVKLESGETVLPMPNIEDPDRLVTDKGQRPDPAGFRPLDAMWPQRSSKLGTYDDKWIRERAPAYPEDLDWTHFNTAAPDQWQDEYFKGDEHYEIANMHPDEPRIEGTLPAYRARCFINMITTEDAGPDFREIPMRMETVCFFPHAKKGVLIYRGMVKVSEDDGSDIRDIVTAYEHLSSPARDAEHYRLAISHRQDEATKLSYLMTTTDLIPEGVVCGFVRLLQGVEGPEMAMMKNMEAKGDELKAQMQAEIDKRRQEMIQQLEAAGIDPAPYIAQFDKAGEIDDPDVKRLMEFIDSIVPGATEGKKEVDIKDIDLSRLGDIQKEMERFAEIQKQKVRDNLQQHIDELGGREETADAAQKIREALQKMDEPPPLPRPEMDQMIVQLRQSIEQASQQYDTLLQQGVGPEQLKALNIDFDVDALEKQVQESGEKLKDVYRMGAHELEKGDPPHVDRMDEKKDEFDSLLQARNLSEGDFAALDLSGMDLSGVDMSGAYLEDVNLSNARLDDANMKDVIMPRAILIGLIATNCDFSGANLGASNATNGVFTACNFTGATFSKSVLENAVFRECDFTGVYFLEARLSGVELSKSKLQKAIFLERDLSGANLTGSDLSNATFLDCELSRTDFSDATLFETSFISAKAANSKFCKANMTNVRFVKASDLAGSDFNDACLDKANLREANLEKADFTGASISMADFSEANLQKAVFNRAQGERPMFMKSDLAQADMSNAGFYEGSLMKARLTSASLKGSNLYGVEFMNATVGGTDFTAAILDQTKLKDWRPEE
jgi:uncharacterized protein YjbI with pentapeptide repeats